MTFSDSLQSVSRSDRVGAAFVSQNRQRQTSIASQQQENWTVGRKQRSDKKHCFILSLLFVLIEVEDSNYRT
jgi:hypothetical protein